MRSPRVPLVAGATPAIIAFLLRKLMNIFLSADSEPKTDCSPLKRAGARFSRDGDGRGGRGLCHHSPGGRGPAST